VTTTTTAEAGVTQAQDLRDFYACSYARLVGVVGAVCRDRDEAEEAVQDAFVRLMGSWSKVSRYDDPEAWIRKVALRQVSNRRRKALNGLKAALRHGPPPDVPEPTPATVDAERALALLPEQQRVVIVLHRVGLDADRSPTPLGYRSARSSRASRGPASRSPRCSERTPPMSDALDRAVDAQVDAYRPGSVPPFEAIEARKRGRDRRRMAVGTGALSVVALAGAGLVVPALNGGGDRLTPSDPPQAVAVTRFAVTYTPTAADVTDPSLGRCLKLPGAQDHAVIEQSDPTTWLVTVDGTPEQTTAVRDCLAALPDAKVETVPDAKTTDGQDRTFRVSSDGTADAAAYTAEVQKCLALPGVTGSSVQESYPATYEMLAAGEAARTLADCLAAVPGAEVKESGDSPAEGTGLDAFINRCVGAENPTPAPGYVGLTEEQATGTEQPEPADTVSVVRVVGRDGTCLGRTRDLRRDRVNLLVADGKVVWAGRF
jgi:DNA-directed RNA polymerase specialized sigma24 family protein